MRKYSSQQPQRSWQAQLTAWSTDALIWRQVKLGATECELTTRTRMALPIIRHLGFPVPNLHFNLQLFRRENLKLFILRRIFRRNTVYHFHFLVLCWLACFSNTRFTPPFASRDATTLIPVSLRLGSCVVGLKYWYSSCYTPSGKKKKKYSIVMLRKATKVHVYLQCFSLSFSKPERTSWSLTPQLDTDIIQVSSVKELSLRGDSLGLYRTYGEIGPTVTHGDAGFYIG